MVQGKSIVAGTFGVVCAVAILVVLGLTQVGTVFSPTLASVASHNSAAPSSSVPSQESVGSASSMTGSASNSYSLAKPGTLNSASLYPSRSSPQTIAGLSSSASSIVLLGVISLIVSLGVVLAVSRRLN